MQHTDTVKELVQISRDGLNFYQDAIREIENPRIKNVFSRMAEQKKNIIESLSTKLRMNYEEVPTDGTMAGTLRKKYADIRATFSSNEEKVYVSQLEEMEDKLLHRFQDALNDISEPTVKSLLQTHMPQVRACHDEMSRLKSEMH